MLRHVVASATSMVTVLKAGALYPKQLKQLTFKMDFHDSTNVALVRDTGAPIDAEAIAARHFSGNVLAGGRMSGGAATAFTDFRMHLFIRQFMHSLETS